MRERVAAHTARNQDSARLRPGSLEPRTSSASERKMLQGWQHPSWPASLVCSCLRPLKAMLLGYDQLRMPYLISRRSFAKLLAAAPLARAFAGERNMFLSLNSVLLQGRVQWPDFARLAAQIGFPGTDIMLGPAMQAGASATNDLLAGLKIRPAVIDFPVEFRKDDATFHASLTQLDAAARFAAAIHCPRMITYIMPSSDTPRDELRQTYKQR